MKPRTKRILLTVLVLGALGMVCAGGIIWAGYSFLWPTSPRNLPATTTLIQTWGRLAPFPPSAHQLSITTTGNMFTRGFKASFVAPPAEIEEWLEQSPGTRKAVPDVPSPGVRHFQIDPGGGAQFAEVTILDSQHRVFIRVWWS